MSKSSDKRCQVTIFVIIAIVIVCVVIGFFLLKNQNSALIPRVPASIQPVYTYLDGCFKDSFEESLLLVGLQGGYTVAPKNSLQTDLTNVAFLFTDNQSSLISKEDVQKQMENYLSISFKKCLENSSLASDYKITYSQISPSVKIEGLKTTASLSAPLTVVKGDSSYSLDKAHTAEQKIRLGELYAITEDIIKQLSNDSYAMDISYLTNLDYEVNIIDYTGGNLLYTFTDNSSILGGQPYLYRFAVKI